MDTAGRVAIVGAGFSGTSLAVQLLRRSGGPVTLIERSGRFGPGLAYGTGCDRHLLNVRSGRMSLLPSEPDHFTRWLAGAGLPADPNGFARRAGYGRYIQATLEAAAVQAPGRLERVTGEVTSLETDVAGVRLGLEDGRSFDARAAVLATGNPPPGPLGLPGWGGDRCIDDPWALGALDRVGPDEDVFLVGTGLTAVDVLLALDAQGWRGRATAVSRRGLLPRVHGAAGADGAEADPPTGPLSRRLGEIRRRAAAEPWTAVMDGLRPHAQAMWLAASPAERRRFLRHLRPWWDVHRHRMAPEIGAVLDRLRAEGRLRPAAGRLAEVTADGRELVVRWRPRGAESAEHARAGWAVNCTGPQGDPARAGEPLLDSLLKTGGARTDRLRLGLDVDDAGRLLDREGRARPGVFAIGPLLRGALWESVAVPEIRVQAEQLAERLAEGPAAGVQGASAKPGRKRGHLEEVGETYFEHMAVAWGVGLRALGAGAACMVHGLAPWWFQKTGSRAIESLHRDLLARRGGGHAGPRPDA